MDVNFTLALSLFQQYSISSANIYNWTLLFSIRKLSKYTFENLFRIILEKCSNRKLNPELNIDFEKGVINAYKNLPIKCIRRSYKDSEWFLSSMPVNLS